MRENVYPNDDPDTAAKKISKDFHFTIPENGNGKDNDKITEILANFETALSIINDCKNCKSKFKQAVPSSK